MPDEEYITAASAAASSVASAAASAASVAASAAAYPAITVVEPPQLWSDEQGWFFNVGPDSSCRDGFRKYRVRQYMDADGCIESLQRKRREQCRAGNYAQANLLLAELHRWMADSQLKRMRDTYEEELRYERQTRRVLENQLDEERAKNVELQTQIAASDAATEVALSDDDDLEFLQEWLPGTPAALGNPLPLPSHGEYANDDVMVRLTQLARVAVARADSAG